MTLTHDRLVKAAWDAMWAELEQQNVRNSGNPYVSRWDLREDGETDGLIDGGVNLWLVAEAAVAAVVQEQRSDAGS